LHKYPMHWFMKNLQKLLSVHSELDSFEDDTRCF
jgi:hypothetical protein